MEKHFKRERAWHNLQKRTLRLIGAVGISEYQRYVDDDSPDDLFTDFMARRQSQDISLPNRESVRFEAFGCKTIILGKRFTAWRAFKDPLNLTALHTIPESDTSYFHHTHPVRISHHLSSRGEYLDYDDILSAAEESVSEQPEFHMDIRA